MTSYIDILISNSLDRTCEEYKKRMFFLVSAFTTFIISALYIILCLFINYQVAINVIYFLLLAHLILFFMNYKNHSLRLIGNLYAGIAWYLSTKVSAFWYARRSDGYTWGALCIIWLVTLSIMELNGHNFTLSYNPQYKSLFSGIMHIGVIGYFMLVLKTYEDWKEKSIQVEKGYTKDKQNLLNILAHDLKNPLMILSLRIKKFFKLMQIDNHESRQEMAAKNIDALKKTIHSMNDILDDLLSKAKNESRNINHKTNLNIFDSLKESIDNGPDEMAKTKDIEIIFEYEKEDLQFQGNKVNFNRVMNNLLSNAIKYSHPLSTIFVSVHIIDNLFQIQVKDCGLGLDKEQIKNIFIPFSHIGNIPTDGEESHGLGLSLTKELIENEFYGKLEATSEGPGKGSTFIVTLPITA